MFVTIRQTEASGHNLFEIVSNDTVCYRAETPWAGLSLPFNAENLRSLVFRGVDGNEIFHTEYDLVENLIQSATSIKSIFGSSTRVAEYKILDREGTAQGAFYARIDGIMTSQFVIMYDGRPYDCYSIALGKIYIISIYDGERQIAQLTKPLDTWNQLDIYYLHLIDGYSGLLPIISFFVIYLDACKFNRAGKYVKYSYEKARAYTFNTNNNKYDSGWIAENFGADEAARLDKLLGQSYGKGGMPKPAKRALIAIAIVVVLIVTGVVGFTVYLISSPKVALTADGFSQILVGQGCALTPADNAPDYTSLSAASGELNIQFYEFVSISAAQDFYNSQRDEYQSEVSGSRSEYSVSRSNSDKYTLISGGSYIVISRVDNTVILCASPESDKPRLDELISALDY